MEAYNKLIVCLAFLCLWTAVKYTRETIQIARTWVDIRPNYLVLTISFMNKVACRLLYITWTTRSIKLSWLFTYNLKQG